MAGRAGQRSSVSAGGGERASAHSAAGRHVSDVGRVRIASLEAPDVDGNLDDARTQWHRASRRRLEDDAVLPAAADMLSWDQRNRVIGFRNTYRLYEGDVFRIRGAAPYPLPPAPYRLPPLRYRIGGRTLRLDDHLRRQAVTGLLVLEDGRVAYEYYGGRNMDTALWTSRSVAESMVSILVGMAIKERLIGSVADSIIRYLPELEGTAWDGATLRDLLQSTSGVAWNEHCDPRVSRASADDRGANRG